jgi:epoxyqueuosine reductase QueG
MDLTRATIEKAKQFGADLFGVADISRFDELPLDRHPRAIFPEARSVVVLGRRITRGSLRGTEEGTNFTNYNLYGYEWLDNRFTSLTTFQVAEFLEDNGWEAVPVPNLPPEVPPMGVRVRPAQPEPNVMPDTDDAAVRAGVGEIGYSGVLLTPQFGPRQRVQMILTDAELEPTPLLEAQVCPRDERCPHSCPLNAYGAPKERVICGKRMTVAQVDYARCRRCQNGARPNRYHPAGKPDRIAAVCIRTCVDCLEKNGRLSNRFQSPFRKREPWTLKDQVDLYRT